MVVTGNMCSGCGIPKAKSASVCLALRQCRWVRSLQLGGDSKSDGMGGSEFGLLSEAFRYNPYARLRGIFKEKLQHNEALLSVGVFTRIARRVSRN